MDPMLLTAAVVQPSLLWSAFKTATGYIKFGGWNFGVQAGIGAAQLVGALSAS